MHELESSVSPSAVGFIPRIVGIGGTTRAGSSSETAVRLALRHAERLGAQTLHFVGPDLMLPLFDPSNPARPPAVQTLLDAVRESHGLIIASPGYHGSISGVLKNVLDYLEELREAEPAYLDARAVGCIACAYGWQASVTTLGALRSIAHALRGWPTPLGVAVNSAERGFDASGNCVDARLDSNLQLLAQQVVDFARMQEQYVRVPRRMAG